MKPVKTFFNIGYTIFILLFIACAVALCVFAVIELWHAVDPWTAAEMGSRLNALLEAIGLVTIAVAALELAETILEEEVQREAHMSAPTRVRRFLSRFLVVIIVSLSIECLVAVFRTIHEDLGKLPEAAGPGIAAGVLLAAWGVFVRLNRSVEELEPEAMEQAKQEDHKVAEGP